jgi:hypothetical protein
MGLVLDEPTVNDEKIEVAGSFERREASLSITGTIGGTEDSNCRFQGRAPADRRKQ